MSQFISAIKNLEAQTNFDLINSPKEKINYLEKVQNTLQRVTEERFLHNENEINEELRKELLTLQESLRSLQEEMGAKTAIITQQREKIEEINKLLSAYEINTDDQKTILSKLEQLGTLKAQNEKLLKDKQNTEKTCQEQSNNLFDRIKELGREKTELQNTLEILKKNFKSRSLEAEDLQELVRRQKGENEDLQKELFENKLLLYQGVQACIASSTRVEELEKRQKQKGLKRTGSLGDILKSGI